MCALSFQAAYAHEHTGMAYMKKNQHHLAVADFSTVLSHNQLDVTAYYNRGMAYSKMGQIPEAVQDFTKVLQVGTIVK